MFNNIRVLQRNHTHTHTHTQPFNSPLSGTTQVSRHQKGKTNLDFTEARDSEWQWQQLGHMQVCTSLQTDNHASTPPLSFLQAGWPSCCPTNSVNALKAINVTIFMEMIEHTGWHRYVCQVSDNTAMTRGDKDHTWHRRHANLMTSSQNVDTMGHRIWMSSELSLLMCFVTWPASEIFPSHHVADAVSLSAMYTIHCSILYNLL